MKKKLLVIGLFLFSEFSLNAQDYTWAKGAGGTAHDMVSGPCNDSNGNTVITGYFISPTINFGATTLINADNTSSTPDAFIVKYDPAGTVLWTKAFGGIDEEYPESVSIDAGGNIYVTGCFFSTSVTFGSYTLSHSGAPTSANMFLVKYDPSGSELWAISPGGGHALDVSAKALDAVTVSGYFVSPTLIFGTDTLTNSFPGTEEVFVAKYDTLGNVLWAKSAGGNELDYSTGVSCDSSGNIFICGTFMSPTITFGSTVLVKDTTGAIPATPDVFVVKYSSFGNVLWAKSIGGSDSDESFSISTDPSSNIFLTGIFRSDTLISGSDTLLNNGDVDSFVLKMDSSGNELWAKSFGGVNADWALGISADASGNTLVTGNYNSPTINFGVATLTNTNVSFPNIFTVNYDFSGNILWAKTADGVSQGWGNGVSFDDLGNAFLSGFFLSPTCTFDTTVINSAGGYDIFLVKINNYHIKVWPGDANHDSIVTNGDILPIGLFYGQAGPSRTSVSNLWQEHYALDWGISQSNGADVKHADCNGDGLVDSNDTLAVNQNFSLTHALAPTINVDRSTNPTLSFTTALGTYAPGSWINVDVMAGTASTPVASLYGLAFNISYDASLLQPGTESLIYPVSWFGSPGTDIIKIGKVDAASSTAFAAVTRIDHLNKSGYGKVATFRFQAKSSISSVSNLNFSISGYLANDSAGIPVLFNPQVYSVVVDPLASINANFEQDNPINIYPNPNNGNFNIQFLAPARSNYKLEVINVLGQIVHSEDLTDFSGTYSKPISIGNCGKGVYTVKLTNDNHGVVKKTVVY